MPKATRPCTRALERLPPPETLERLRVSLATLDTILCPEWEFRMYSFSKDWDPERGHFA